MTREEFSAHEATAELLFNNRYPILPDDDEREKLVTFP